MEAFDALAGLAPAQRAAKLAKLNLADALAERLRAMFAAEEGEGLLDTGLTAGGAADGPPVYTSLDPGTVVGGFRVERLIGRGGMGEVYLAHRDGADFDQRAALKLLRPKRRPVSRCSAPSGVCSPALNIARSRGSSTAASHPMAVPI
jgi:non-specific serine/threonine protein kinase/serine/threonine-protein kinase